MGSKGLEPPANSWAHDEMNDVMILLIELKPNAELVLPAEKHASDSNSKCNSLCTSTNTIQVFILINWSHQR